MAIDVKYDKDEDILYLNDNSKTSKYSFGVGDVFVLDFDERDKIIGVEILDASEVLYGATKEILKNITSARLRIKYDTDLIMIGIAIKSEAAPAEIYSSIPVSLVARS